MRVVRDWRNGPPEFRGAVAPIGNFDGVHRGHRALIAQARSEAAKSGAAVAAIVFEPHPVEFFKPGGPSFRLTPFDAKARLLAAEGLDVLFVLRFDAELAAMPPGAFVGDVLADGFLAHGYEVMRGTRDPKKLAAWKSKAGARASVGTFAEAAKFGRLVVLAVKGTAAEADSPSRPASACSSSSRRSSVLLPQPGPPRTTSAGSGTSASRARSEPYFFSLACQRPAADASPWSTSKASSTKRSSSS